MVASSATVMVAATLAAPSVMSSPTHMQNSGTLSRNAVESRLSILNEHPIDLETVEAGGLVFKLVASNEVGQAYFWTPQWQEQERLADADLRRGDYEEFENVEDAIAWLFDGEA